MSELSKQLTAEFTEAAAEAARPTLDQLKNTLRDDEEVQRAVRAEVARTYQSFTASLSDEQPEPQFSDVFDFVENFLSRIYCVADIAERQTNWSAHWFEYEHAVLRLTALWQRYEQLKIAEPATFMETFLRVHGDYHMRQLMSPDGVFAYCKRQEAHTRPLATAPAQPDPADENRPTEE